MSSYNLSPTAQTLARICGLQGALSLAREYGGRQVYIPTPATLHARHKIVAVLGMDTAQALCTELAGTRLNIPLCLGPLRAARDRQIWDAYTAGESCFAIARRHAMNARSVWRIVQRLRERGGPPDAAAGVSPPRDSSQLAFRWASNP